VAELLQHVPGQWSQNHWRSCDRWFCLFVVVVTVGVTSPFVTVGEAAAVTAGFASYFAAATAVAVINAVHREH